MDIGRSPLSPGLYLVATPIGSARDITLRALDVLTQADVLAAEDTRTTRRLLDIHGIALNGRPLRSYHDHSPLKDRAYFMEKIAAGNSVAYVSEAGTPLVADPGFRLVQDAINAGVSVVPVPGASAVLAALVVSGLPTDRFMFAGFLPNSTTARRKALENLQVVPATLVIYESPRRILNLIEDAIATFGPDRPAALARELTKTFEECRRGTLEHLYHQLHKAPARGECVLLVNRAGEEVISDAQLVMFLQSALETQSVKEAVAEVTKATGLPRRQVYQRALELNKP